MSTKTETTGSKMNPFARTSAVTNVPSDDIMFEMGRPWRARSIHERTIEACIREGIAIHRYRPGNVVRVNHAGTKVPEGAVGWVMWQETSRCGGPKVCVSFQGRVLVMLEASLDLVDWAR